MSQSSLGDEFAIAQRAEALIPRRHHAVCGARKRDKCRGGSGGGGVPAVESKFVESEENLRTQARGEHALATMKKVRAERALIVT